MSTFEEPSWTSYGLWGMSPTAKRITLLNSEINPRKYEHSYQVKELNLDGQVSPQQTQ